MPWWSKCQNEENEWKAYCILKVFVAQIYHALFSAEHHCWTDAKKEAGEDMRKYAQVVPEEVQVLWFYAESRLRRNLGSEEKVLARAMDAAGLWWASGYSQIQHLIFSPYPNWERKTCSVSSEHPPVTGKVSKLLLHTDLPGLISKCGLTVQAIRCNFSLLPVNRLDKYTLGSIATTLSTSNS